MSAATLSASERARLTYRWESRRAISSGILETAATFFLLLIAVRWFNAGATAKALVAGGGSAGLLLSPVIVWLVQKSGLPSTKAASRLSLLGSACFLTMALAPSLPVFVIGSVLSMAAASAAVPLLTQVYHDNYPTSRRGSFFSRTVMIRIGVATLFSELVGQVVTHHLDRYRYLLLLFAAAFAFASHCLSHCPSSPLQKHSSPNPFRSLRFARTDPLFRHTLIAWMLMGFANLMMLPMRIEYLANPRYGLSFSPAEIAFLTGVVPNAARLFLSPLWGSLFDRMNFFTLRITLNIGFALGILAFFTTNSLTGLVAGAIVHGIANAGGDVAWGLWVTKFAPPNRVADYMSAHTFFTGIRGVLAPLVAFHLVTFLSMPTLGWIAGTLITLASLLLLPELHHGHGRTPAPEPTPTPTQIDA